MLYQALEQASGTFLDAGAGDGSRAADMLRSGRLAGFHRIVATDISPLRTRAMRLHLPPNVVTLVADSAALPFDDGEIDFYFSDQVIEHVPDDRAFAREIHRVLALHGRAFVGSVTKGRRAWYFYRCKGEWRLDPTHLREYCDLASFLATFRDADLEVLWAETVPMGHPIADYVLRLLVLIGLVPKDRAVTAYLRYPVLRALRSIRIPIPGYHSCYALLSRRKVPR